MRIIADENIPISILKEIKNTRKDIKILRIDELKKDMNEDEIIEICIKYDCSLLTFNKSFAEKVGSKIKSVILLDFTPKSLKLIKERVLKFLKTKSNEDIKGKFIKIREESIIIE